MTRGSVDMEAGTMDDMYPVCPVYLLTLGPDLAEDQCEQDRLHVGAVSAGAGLSTGHRHPATSST